VMDKTYASSVGEVGSVAMPPLHARIRARTDSSRRLIRRAHLRAQAQDRLALAARQRAQQRVEANVDRWPRAHGLAPAVPGRRYDESLTIVLTAASALFGGCRAVSLTTVDQIGDGRPRHRTAAATGNAEALDAAQFRLAQGPGLDALELDLTAVVRADDLQTGGDAAQWPLFAHAAEALGVRSAMSISVPWNAARVGLQAEHRALGAINLYAAERHAFTQSELYTLMFGAWAASILSGMRPTQIFDGHFDPGPPLPSGDARP
jgi:hypothetical protein